MGILQRTADIFSANLNDLVDRFEDPKQMLRHGLREIEALLATTSAAVARSIATEKLLAASRARHETEAERWQERAAAAVEAANDSLARRAIARKLDHARAISDLDGQLAAVHATNETLRRQLDVLRDRHAAARTRLTLVAARQATAEAQRHVLTSLFVPGAQTKAMARFERFYEKLEFAEAQAVALVELESHGEAELEVEFNRRATRQAIDEELERIKAASHAEER